MAKRRRRRYGGRIILETTLADMVANGKLRTSQRIKAANVLMDRFGPPQELEAEIDLRQIVRESIHPFLAELVGEEIRRAVAAL